MATERVLIDSKSSGSLLENDDEWTLVIDTETGTMQVEHAWEHTDPYRHEKSSAGTRFLSVDEFRSSAPQLARERFEKILHERGVA